MTTLNLPGVIRPAQAEQVRRYVGALLESKLVPRPNLGESIAVALGGNAETLANVAPGPRQHGLLTIDLSLLRARLPEILRRDVRDLSIQLSDQLQPIHHMPAHSRVLLEAGALLLDTGHLISHRGHHKHGEYLALNGDIPGLEGRDRAVVAALVRYHNRKSEPAGHHTAYSSLNNADKRVTRRLAAILRIAE